MSLKEKFETETGKRVYPYDLFSPVSMDYVKWLENIVEVLEFKRIKYLKTISHTTQLILDGNIKRIDN